MSAVLLILWSIAITFIDVKGQNYGVMDHGLGGMMSGGHMGYGGDNYQHNGYSGGRQNSSKGKHRSRGPMIIPKPFQVPVVRNVPFIKEVPVPQPYPVIKNVPVPFRVVQHKTPKTQPPTYKKLPIKKIKFKKQPKSQSYHEEMSSRYKMPKGDCAHDDYDYAHNAHDYAHDGGKSSKSNKQRSVSSEQLKYSGKAYLRFVRSNKKSEERKNVELRPSMSKSKSNSYYADGMDNHYDMSESQAKKPKTIIRYYPVPDKVLRDYYLNSNENKNSFESEPKIHYVPVPEEMLLNRDRQQISRSAPWKINRKSNGSRNRQKSKAKRRSKKSSKNNSPSTRTITSTAIPNFKYSDSFWNRRTPKRKTNDHVLQISPISKHSESSYEIDRQTSHLPISRNNFEIPTYQSYFHSQLDEPFFQHRSNEFASNSSQNEFYYHNSEEEFDDSEVPDKFIVMPHTLNMESKFPVRINKQSDESNYEDILGTDRPIKSITVIKYGNEKSSLETKPSLSYISSHDNRKDGNST